MTITLVPVVAIILGILLWVFGPGPKVQEAGKIMFAVGMLWFVGGQHGTALTIK